MAPFTEASLPNGHAGDDSKPAENGSHHYAAPVRAVCQKPQEMPPSTEQKPHEKATAVSLSPCSADSDQRQKQLWTSAFEWTLDFPLAAVWNLTHDFVNISKWLPTYMRSSALVHGTPQQPGCVRSVIGFQDDIPPAFDELLEMDELNHKFKYRILTCHLPLLMGHSPTYQFLPASPTSTLLKFTTERPPVPNFDEQSYRTFVYELYSGFVSDLINTLSTSASASASASA